MPDAPAAPWLVPLVVERVTLFLNHLLYAEPAALARLRPHAGKVVMLRLQLGPLGPWDRAGAGRETAHAVRITAAGLVEPADRPAGGSPAPEAGANLDVVLDLARPLDVLRELLRGRRPPMRIEGDAALATDVAWLVDNVRWDAEEDLARLVGDAWAHESFARARAAVDVARGALGRLLDRGARTPSA